MRCPVWLFAFTLRSRWLLPRLRLLLLPLFARILAFYPWFSYVVTLRLRWLHLPLHPTFAFALVTFVYTLRLPLYLCPGYLFYILRLFYLCPGYFARLPLYSCVAHVTFTPHTFTYVGYLLLLFVVDLVALRYLCYLHLLLLPICPTLLLLIYVYLPVVVVDCYVAFTAFVVCVVVAILFIVRFATLLCYLPRCPVVTYVVVGCLPLCICCCTFIVVIYCYLYLHFCVTVTLLLLLLYVSYICCC